MTVWSVYIIRCGDDSLYTGIATDVARRFSEHQLGRIGSKYLRGRSPLELVFEQQVGDRSKASKIEHRIKKLSRVEKEKIVTHPSLLDDMILEID
jgi:putative endonuclease